MATEIEDDTITKMVEVLDGLVKLVELLDERITKLELSERGLIPYSNDPTEIEHAEAKLIEVPKQKLHSWAIYGTENPDEQITKCLSCGALLTDCGATEDSWYCS